MADEDQGTAKQQRPRLVALREADAGQALEADAEPEPPRSRSPRVWLGWLVALACALGWVTASGDARELRRELAAQATALADSEAHVTALTSHLARMREQAATLSEGARALAEQSAALESALADGPPAAPDPDAAPPTER